MSVKMQLVQVQIESHLEDVQRVLGNNYKLALVAKCINPEFRDADIILTLLSREQIVSVLDRHLPEGGTQ